MYQAIRQSSFMHLWDNKLTALREVALNVLHAMKTCVTDGVLAQLVCNGLQFAAWMWYAGCM